MEAQEKSLIEQPALGGGEVIGYEMTERQSGVLPAAIEDARYFRDHAAEMVEFLRKEIERAVEEDAEEWRIAQRAERREGYAKEYYRGARLVAFLEKLREGQGG